MYLVTLLRVPTAANDTGPGPSGVLRISAIEKRLISRMNIDDKRNNKFILLLARDSADRYDCVTIFEKNFSVLRGSYNINIDQQVIPIGIWLLFNFNFLCALFVY